MNEPIVQWTLLNNLDYLSRVLDFRVAKKKGQEITTDFGRIDFIVEDYNQHQLIVELETVLNIKNKLSYCFNQILNYKNVRFVKQTSYCLLYADETSQDVRSEIQEFGRRNSVWIKTYSLTDVQNLYTDTVRKLSLSFGLALPKPKNYTICYLRWLNKILKPFHDNSKSTLTKDQTAKYFSSPDSTNFRCYSRLAQDFEMVFEKNGHYILTENGADYVNNFNPEIDIVSNLPSVNLTNEQRKILMRVITNGNWTSHKVNIYWFLRFIEVSNGEWIPNLKIFDAEKLELLNGLFGVQYRPRTMYEFLNFACNWCMELGLVDRIKSRSNYDKLYLTPLGIEINNIFSLDLQIKKSRLNLNFKYLEQREVV